MNQNGGGKKMIQEPILGVTLIKQTKSQGKSYMGGGHTGEDYTLSTTRTAVHNCHKG